MLDEGPFFWSIKKQNTISLYSAEVEFRGVVNVATQCVWLQGILQEIDVVFDSPTTIWCGNQSAIYVYIYIVNRKRKHHI